MYQKALQCIPEMREGEKRPDPSTFEGRTLDQLLGAREELTRRMEEARAMSGESRVATAGVVAMPVPLGDRQVTKFLAGAEEVPWREWLKGLEGLDREVVKGLMQNLFNGEPCMINIPIPNEEWTKQPIETYLGRMGMERTALDSLVIRYNMGNVTVRLYRDTEDGRAKLLKEVESEIQEKGIAKPERRIVSFAVKEAKSEKLEKLSYVVYLDRREGQTTLPVGHCGLLGLGILNYFNLEEKKASEEELRAAIDVIAKGISALTGEDDIKEIVKKVEEFVKRGDFAKSGFLMIEIRPIRTEEIKEFHEAEAQILRSL
jgi:hypothetical protein